MTKKLTPEQEALLEECKKTYEVRDFATTTESLNYTRKMASAMSNMKVDLDAMKDEDVSAIFEFFDPTLIKYVVDTFVMKKGKKKSKPVNYEKEFIGDFGMLMGVFLMAVKHLSEKATGGKKPQAPAQEVTEQIVSTKRS